MAAANDLSVFKFDDRYVVRVKIINEEPWFVAKDVCDALGHQEHIRRTQASR